MVMSTLAWVAVMCASMLPYSAPPEVLGMGYVELQLALGLLMIAILAFMLSPDEWLRRAYRVPSAPVERFFVGSIALFGLVIVGLRLWLPNRLAVADVSGLLGCSCLFPWAGCGMIRSLGIHPRFIKRFIVLTFVLTLSLPLGWVIGFLLDADAFFDLMMLAATASTVFISPLLMVLYCAKHPPARKGHCRACDYDLTGNVAGRCPECGTPIAAGTEPAAPPGPAEVKNAG